MDATEELELSRAIGRLEGKTDALASNQEKLTTAINTLSKGLKRRAWYDSAFEGRASELTNNQARLVTAVSDLKKDIKRKVWYDSVKVVTGAFMGGFTAVFVKLGIWGS